MAIRCDFGRSKRGIARVSEEDRTITVRVNGENRSELLGSIRATLNLIFKGYQSKKPDLQYRIDGMIMDTDKKISLLRKMNKH